MTAAPASNPELPAARKLRRRWPGRLLWFAVLGPGAAGLLWAAAAWWLPGRKAADVLTAAATRGELVITVTDRGELESSQSVEVVCEVEGGAKVAKIVTEGTRVKKGDEVVRFDPDSLLKLINEQEVKWEQADGKVKSSVSELEVQKNKAESEIAKADLALTLAKLDYESYEEGEYQVEVDKRKGTLELGKTADLIVLDRDLYRIPPTQIHSVKVLLTLLDGRTVWRDRSVW